LVFVRIISPLTVIETTSRTVRKIHSRVLVNDGILKGPTGFPEDELKILLFVVAAFNLHGRQRYLWCFSNHLAFIFQLVDFNLHLPPLVPTPCVVGLNLALFFFFLDFCIKSGECLGRLSEMVRLNCLLNHNLFSTYCRLRHAWAPVKVVVNAETTFCQYVLKLFTDPSIVGFRRKLEAIQVVEYRQHINFQVRKHPYQLHLSKKWLGDYAACNVWSL